MNQIIIQQILYMVVIPALMTGITLFLSQKSNVSFIKALGMPLAVVVGFMGGYVGLLSWPPFPPQQTSQWFFYTAFIAFILGWFEAIQNAYFWRNLFLRFSFFVLLFYFSTQFMFEYHWSSWEAFAWICGLSLFVMTTLHLWSRQISFYVSSRLTSLFLSLSALSSAVIFMLRGSASLTEILGVLTVVGATFFFYTAFQPEIKMFQGTITSFLWILYLMILPGHFLLTNPPTIPILLVMSAPWFVYVLVWGYLPKSFGFKCSLLKCFVFLVPIGFSVIIVIYS